MSAGAAQAARRRAPRLALAALALALSPLAIARAAATPAGTARAGARPAVTASAPAPGGTPSPPPAVGLRVLRLVDRTRRIRLPGGRSAPRTLLTYVRYPALAASGRLDVPNAPAAAAQGPFPLVVFGHGFAVTPAIYGRLLQSWAAAGFVVAAPLFPLANANAPGGPDESDLINQPRDMSFVISRLLAASAARAGSLAGLIDPARIAVAGQSDGGETALASAYSRRFRDPRVSAAIILSGAEMGGVHGYSFSPGGPALLAVQGTADTLNEPRFTYAFFRAARRPKFLLRLLGAEHLAPYTRAGPQLALVERVSIAFLDSYLARAQGALQRLLAPAVAPKLAAFTAEP